MNNNNLHNILNALNVFYFRLINERTKLGNINLYEVI